MNKYIFDFTYVYEDGKELDSSLSVVTSNLNTAWRHAFNYSKCVSKLEDNVLRRIELSRVEPNVPWKGEEA